MSRLVVVLFGPSGAGKTTIARASSDLDIFDRDDPQWRDGGERVFRLAIARLATQPDAQAVVIRAGATTSARVRTLQLVGATHAFLVMPDKDACHYRAGHRRRADVHASHASIETWYAKFEHKDGVPPWPGAWEAARAMPLRHVPHREKAGRRQTRPTGHAYRKARAAVLAASDICHLCGHGGARQSDHIIPRSKGGDTNDPLNQAPAHGGGRPGVDNPCPTCGRRCNQEKGNGVFRVAVRSREW